MWGGQEGCNRALPLGLSVLSSGAQGEESRREQRGGLGLGGAPQGKALWGWRRPGMR